MKGWILIVVSWVVTCLMWMGAKELNVATSSAQGATQIVALLGLISLAWTFILATRHAVIETLFEGLDKAYKAHHILGGLALILLINHVLLLLVASLPANTLTLYLLPGTSLPYTLGILALYVMLFLLILTFYINLPYRYWKWSHEWMGLVIIFGGLHSLLISSDTLVYMPLRYWVIAWSILALLAFLYKRFGYYLMGVSSYKILQLGSERDLLVISLESSAEAIKFSPGQYGFFSVNERKRDEHAFSILGSEDRKLIIGVKVVGNFTQKLAQLKIGDILRVKGPFGTFGEKMNHASHAVWIAGGIGITPFLSMAQAARSDQKIEMYFCARVMPPKVITEPFDSLSQKNPNFTWLPCETSRGGRLSARRIFEETGTDRQAYYLLCGPKAMMEEIAFDLAKLGIKRSHIIYEDFAFK